MIALECSALFASVPTLSGEAHALHPAAPGVVVVEGKKHGVFFFRDAAPARQVPLRIWPRPRRILSAKVRGDALHLSGTTSIHKGVHVWSVDAESLKQRWQSQADALESAQKRGQLSPEAARDYKQQHLALTTARELSDWHHACAISSAGCYLRPGPGLPRELIPLLEGKPECSKSPLCKLSVLRTSLAPPESEVAPGAPTLSTEGEAVSLQGIRLLVDDNLPTAEKRGDGYQLRSFQPLAQGGSTQREAPPSDASRTDTAEGEAGKHVASAEGGLARVVFGDTRREGGGFHRRAPGTKFSFLVRLDEAGSPVGSPVRFGPSGLGGRDTASTVMACTQTRCLVAASHHHGLDAWVVELPELVLATD